MDFDAAVGAVRALLVEAWRRAEELLAETNYTEWGRIIEARAARDWFGEFEALIRPILRHVSQHEQYPAVKRAAKHFREALRRMLAFIPITFKIDDAPLIGSGGDPVAIRSSRCRPRLDAIRAESRGTIERMKAAVQAAWPTPASAVEPTPSTEQRIHLTNGDKLILTVLAGAGRDGLSYSMIDKAITEAGEELTSSRVRNRVPDLRRLGLIESTGNQGSRDQKHYITGHGRWVLSPNSRMDL